MTPIESVRKIAEEHGWTLSPEPSPGVDLYTLDSHVIAARHDSRGKITRVHRTADDSVTDMTGPYRKERLLTMLRDRTDEEYPPIYEPRKGGVKKRRLSFSRAIVD